MKKSRFTGAPTGAILNEVSPGPALTGKCFPFSPDVDTKAAAGAAAFAGLRHCKLCGVTSCGW
jgi:hypothetical protein